MVPELSSHYQERLPSAIRQAQIIFSQRDAFIKVLNKKKIPYREIYINDFTESSIGEIFSYFMLETIMISKLINVNPFDQPAVEEVKNLTKKFLN